MGEELIIKLTEKARIYRRGCGGGEVHGRMLTISQRKLSIRSALLVDCENIFLNNQDRALSQQSRAVLLTTNIKTILSGEKITILPTHHIQLSPIHHEMSLPGWFPGDRSTSSTLICEGSNQEPFSTNH